MRCLLLLPKNAFPLILVSFPNLFRLRLSPRTPRALQATPSKSLTSIICPSLSPIGDVTAIVFGGPSWGEKVSSINAINCKTLVSISSTGPQNHLETLKIPTSLTFISIYDDPGTNVLENVWYAGNNSAVANKVAYFIGNSNISEGTLHADSTAAYYSTIANAATTKGWDIQPL